MKVYRTMRTALRALRRNPMRAALTTLGIIIGVAAVIAMMEIGNGSSLAMQRTISSMGANNLLIVPGTAASGGISYGAGTVLTMTPQDAEAIARECPAVGPVAPIVRARTQVVYGNRNWVPMFIYGTTPEYLRVREWTRLASDVFAVAHASYIAELVAALLPAESPEPEALDVIVGLWDSLAEAGPSPAALRHVELALLEPAGQQPALQSCAACGETALETGAVFDPARGGAICRRCAAQSRGPGVRPLEPGTRAYLVEVERARSASEARVVDERHAPGDRTAARDAMLAMVTSLVGKPLKSLEYIATLGAAAHRPT